LARHRWTASRFCCLSSSWCCLARQRAIRAAPLLTGFTSGLALLPPPLSAPSRPHAPPLVWARRSASPRPAPGPGTFARQLAVPLAPVGITRVHDLVIQIEIRRPNKLQALGRPVWPSVQTGEFPPSRRARPRRAMAGGGGRPPVSSAGYPTTRRKLGTRGSAALFLAAECDSISVGSAVGIGPTYGLQPWADRMS
jgi:hypothetical protein